MTSSQNRNIPLFPLMMQALPLPYYCNKNAFLCSVSPVNWYPLLNDTDMQSTLGMFPSKLLELYNKHFSKKRQRVRYRYNSSKHWLSQGLKDGIKTKNKPYIKYIKIPSVYNVISLAAYYGMLTRNTILTFD